MMTLSLPFTCARVVPAGPASRMRPPRSFTGTRATAPVARGGGDGSRARAEPSRRRHEAVLWHDVVVRKRARRLPSLRAITRVESSGDDEETEAGTGTVPEADGSGEKKLKDNQVQLPMKKRSAEMSFTCNVCQHRTTRMVNPHAFKNGTMFAQCAGCEAWHKIVDNLGLIYEFPKEEA